MAPLFCFMAPLFFFTALLCNSLCLFVAPLFVTFPLLQQILT